MLAEVQVGKATYRIFALPARKQVHIARRLGPFVTVCIPLLPQLLDKSIPKVDKVIMALPMISGMMAGISDEHADYIFDGCLDACYRKGDTGWAPVRSNGVPMFSDMTMMDEGQLVVEVITSQFLSFTEEIGSKVSGVAESKSI